MDGNTGAFLAMIRHSEGTDKAPDPYAVTYGYQFTITDFSDHPTVLGDWMGESLANLGPQYAGKVSTAAGAYQIIRPTWEALKARLGLPDFSPASQDAAAVELIREKGALNLVSMGRVSNAIMLCHSIWASLPGSTAGQPTSSFASLINAYGDAGGMLS